MASNQRSQHALTFNAQEISPEDFMFEEDSLNKECLRSCLTFLCENLTSGELVCHLEENEILTRDEVHLILVSFSSNKC